MKRVVLAVLVALSATGCAHSPQEAIVGKWQDEKTGVVIEFAKTGDFLRKSPKPPGDVKGTYVLADNEEITLTVAKESIIGRCKISGNEMDLVLAGQNSTLKRVS